jgi:hypothetical protein
MSQKAAVKRSFWFPTDKKRRVKNEAAMGRHRFFACFITNHNGMGIEPLLYEFTSVLIVRRRNHTRTGFTDRNRAWRHDTLELRLSASISPSPNKAMIHAERCP